jgi:transglutaminase-like putative cysteine protease
LFTSRSLRYISKLVLVSFTCLTLQPLQVVAQTNPITDYLQGSAPLPAPVAAESIRKSEHYSRTLDDLREVALRAEEKVKSSRSDEDEIIILRNKKNDLEAMTASIAAEFQATEQHLKNKNLPAIFMERHVAAVADFNAKRAEFQSKVDALLLADTAKDTVKRRAATAELNTFLRANHPGKPHKLVDPKNLPLRNPSGKVRPPKLTQQSYDKELPGTSSTLLAALLPVNLSSVPSTAPSPDDLAETEDIKLTPAIRALANSLDNNPVKIHRWVHNNVKYLPTHGSVQGADLTRQTKQGNAFDTSGLLIALLRAANIPARYVYGTIEMPVESVMNWQGTSTPEASLQIASQGGIPSAGNISGGAVSKVQLEHIWVEAWVDYVPSRGAINKVGDSWVPLEATIKPTQNIPGLDFKTAVPFNAEAIFNEAKATAIIDTANSSVTNLNSSVVENALNDYQTRIRTYLDATKPNATADEIIGVKKIIPRTDPILLGTLPYKTIVRGGTYSALPANLRHSVTITLHNTFLGAVFDFGGPLISHTISLPALNTRRLGVTYAPATDADAQILQSYKDQQATSLPVYLIKVKPLLQLDGITLAEGPVIGMGMAQVWRTTFIEPGQQAASADTFLVTAGDEMVFGINGNGMKSTAVLERLGQPPSDTAAENLQQVALTFWMELDLFDELTAEAHKVRAQRMPSAGVFSSPLSSGAFLFGAPISGSYRGRQIDLQRNVTAVAAPDQATHFAFMTQTGIQMSYLEGSVLDQIFRRPQGTGVSTAQLQMEANAQGIPIYTVNKANLAQIMPQLEVSAAVKADISNAVNAGRTATVPKRTLVHGKYIGSGYILQDPESGAAGYLIAGGANGGFTLNCVPATEVVAVAVSAAVQAVAAAMSSDKAKVLVKVAVVAGAIVISVLVITNLLAIVPFFAFAMVAIILAATMAATDAVAKGVTGGSGSGDDGCSCGAHYSRCVESGWDRPLPSFGGNLCSRCLQICTSNGGDKAGNWPSSIPTFPGGPVNANLSCQYPGFH